MLRSNPALGIKDPTDDKSNGRFQDLIVSVLRLFGLVVAAAKDLSLEGNLILSTLGKGLRIKEGVGARMGVATLVAGTVTIANTSITSSTRIIVSRQTSGGTLGHLSGTRVSGTSFTITSSSASDTSVVAWVLVEPAA
jgi:hypothetical protein